MKAICSSIFFVVSRQKACIKTKAGLDFEECKSRVKRDATIVSCNAGNAPEPPYAIISSVSQLNILTPNISLLVLFFSLFVSDRGVNYYITFANFNVETYF